MSSAENDEIWKPIPGYEGYYEASTWGRIKAVNRTIHQRRSRRDGVLVFTRTLRERIIAQSSDYPGGYLRVRLSRNGMGQTYTVHRLVLMAHRGKCPPGQQACHWDDTNTNNTLANLRWDWPENNVADRRRNGGYDFTGRRKGAA